ncbi:MAG TPA: amidase family protein [Chloroflexota bacterium]
MSTVTTGLDAFAPARAMLDALRERQISSRELVELHLARIERHNAALNAIVVPGDDPLGAAEQADEARARNDGRALLGLPVTLKESMNVPGLPTTVGVLDFKEFRAGDLGAVPERVLGAGAVLLGKTNVPPMLADWQATNPIYGRTVNPWNAALTPGGSTGGGAAAVAAGLSPLEFGSDIGGSIRVPASFCGIFGHKPSETTVPRSGQFPRPSVPNAGSVMGVQGPLARTAADLELALRVIAGPEVGEDVAWRLELPLPRHESLAAFRVAVMPRLDWLPVSAEILGVLDTLASRLSRAGATVRLAAPETFGDLREHHALYMSVLSAVTSPRLSREDRERQAKAAEINRELPWATAKAAAWSAGVAEWLSMHERREHYRAAYRAFFRDWDILLAPITLCTAFPHLDLPWPPPQTPGPITMVDIDGQLHPYEDQLVYPALATLSGQPATAFPVGLSKDGMPIGLQAIGPYLEDFTPIRFAAYAAEEMGGLVRPPGFDT